MNSPLSLAFRSLIKQPGFTTVAVLTLALGVGLNTSMFTALQHLLLRDLPYPEPNRLVQLFRHSPGSPRQTHHSVADVLDFQGASSGLGTVAAMDDGQFSLSTAGAPPERVPGLRVTASFFPALGVEPLLGRFFTAQEDQPGQPRVVVLDHGFWQERFAGDPSIVGRDIRLDGESATVIGVMPPQFRDPLLAGPAFLWCPIAFTTEQKQSRSHYFLRCIARLPEGVSPGQAEAALKVVGARLQADTPHAPWTTLSVIPLSESSLPPQAKLMLGAVMALAAFVLLIACVNLANLEFARAAARSRDLAIRATLGATRPQLVIPMLAECLLLGLAGGSLGLLLAVLGNHLISSQLDFDHMRVLQLHLNGKVFAFGLLTATLSGLAFGLLPAWLATRADVQGVLKRGARGQTSDRSQRRVQAALIVAQLALALVLLSGAAMLLDGLRRFQVAHPGWTPQGLTLGHLSLPENRYGTDDERQRFVSRLLEEISALPGARHASVAWNLPLRQYNVSSSFQIDGREDSDPLRSRGRYINGVTPAFFDALGLRLIAGRTFDRSDTADRPPVVIINHAMARAFWPDVSPLGQRINGEEIVGVVNDVRFPANPADQRTSFQTYRPYTQSSVPFLSMAVQGGISGEQLRRVVAALDPDLPVGGAGPATLEVKSSLDRWAFAGRLLAAFAALGVFLAALGVYGLISGAVARRRGEISLRMALGASIQGVLWLVLHLGLRLGLQGIALGLVGTYALARLMASVLHALPPAQPLVTAGVALFLLAVTTLACSWPAWRAARVDPAEALRCE